MPTYEPDEWNQPWFLSLNNCYNYATNHRFGLPPNVAGPKRPGPAVPGHAQGISPGIPWGWNSERIYWEFTCKSVRAACIADGLRAPNDDGDCPANCWRIAYFVRPPSKDPDAPVNGDYHFVREDSPGSWSHKPNRTTDPVTQNQYNPVSKKYDGKPITDPAKDNVGPGYKFCGYLCCCENQQVAMLEDSQHGEGESAVALTYGDDLGSPHSGQLSVGWTELRNEVLAIASELDQEWSPGYADEPFHYRLDSLPGALTPVGSVLIASRSVTLIDPEPRFIEDREARALCHFRARLERTPKATAEPAAQPTKNSNTKETTSIEQTISDLQTRVAQLEEQAGQQTRKC